MIRARTVWDNLKPGETVLIEHSSRVEPTLLFYELVDWAREKGYPVLIDDVLDTLYLYKAQLDLAGIDTSFLNDIKVIKFGGRLNVGQVVERLHIKEPTIREHEYRRAFEPLMGGGAIVNPVLGFGKLFALAESTREVLELINEILIFAGNESRIAFYFINTDVLKGAVTNALPWIEELASTIIEVGRDGKLYRFSVVKSVNNKLSGLEFTLP